MTVIRRVAMPVAGVLAATAVLAGCGTSASSGSSGATSTSTACSRPSGFPPGGGNFSARPHPSGRPSGFPSGGFPGGRGGCAGFGGHRPTSTATTAGG